MATRTYRTNAFIEAARRLGVQVVVGSELPQALSELSPGRTLTLNFLNPEEATQAIVEFAKERPISAVVPSDDDTTILAAMASAALSLPHNSVQSVATARNKHLFRKTLAEAGLPSPQFEILSTDDAPDNVTPRTGYPCVLKPLFLAASRGVIRANDRTQFVEAFCRIAEILRTPEVETRGGAAARQILVETFMPGAEVALEGLLSNGHLKVLALFDKPDPLDGPFFEETLYITPSRFPAAVQEEIAASAAQAVKALGLQEGPVHAEFRVNEQGPWVIEVAARSIGGLCSRTLRFGTGLSLEELILRHAMGMKLDSLEREGQAAGVMMIPIPRAGVLKEVRGLGKAESVAGIEEITISLRPGEHVVPLPEGGKYLGFLFARGENSEQVEKALRKAHRRLKFAITPEPRA